MDKRRVTEAELDFEYSAFTKRLGWALRKARRDLDISPDVVVKVAGIKTLTAARLRLIETATVSDLNFREAGRLCEVCGVSLQKIMGDWGKAERIAHLCR